MPWPLHQKVAVVRVKQHGSAGEWSKENENGWLLTTVMILNFLEHQSPDIPTTGLASLVLRSWGRAEGGNPCCNVRVVASAVEE